MRPCRAEEERTWSYGTRWLFGLGVALAAAPAFGQAPVSTPAAGKPAAGRTACQDHHRRPDDREAGAGDDRRATSQPGTPHTLAEALAATYSSQPALLAERAKLRATDENVPQALSGWRPTVVMAGTAGYGDGMTRIISGSSGAVPQHADRPDDRHGTGVR